MTHKNLASGRRRSGADDASLLEPIEVDGGDDAGLGFGAVSAPLGVTDGSNRTRRRLRWSAGLLSVLVTAIVGHGVVSHRAAEKLSVIWSAAVVERGAVDATLIELREISPMARAAGDQEFAHLEAVRRETAAASARKLGELHDRLARLWVLDPDTARVRRSLGGEVERWVDQLAAYGSGEAQVAPDHDGEELEARSAELRRVQRRWRTGVPNAPRPETDPAVDRLLARLRRPTDEPVPAVITAVTSSGKRLDADLRSGSLEETELDLRPPTMPTASGLIGAVVGGSLAFQLGERAYLLPAEPGNGVVPLEPGRLSTEGVGTWIISYDESGARARRLDAEGPEIRLTDANYWGVLGATGNGIVLQEFVSAASGHDVVERLWRLDPSTGHRERIPDGRRFLAADHQVEVWTHTNEAQVEIVSSTSTRVLDIDGGRRAGLAEVAGDGTVVLGLVPTGQSPFNMVLGLVRPGASSIELVHTAPFVAGLLAHDGWIFWGEPTAPLQPLSLVLQARELATGRTMRIRLPSTAIVGFVVHTPTS